MHEWANLKTKRQRNYSKTEENSLLKNKIWLTCTRIKKKNLLLPAIMDYYGVII